MIRTIHMASKIRADGAVSALCFSKPRAIDLNRASWTQIKDVVTCSRCLKLIKEQAGV